jgi:hypothetical protein
LAGRPYSAQSLWPSDNWRGTFDFIESRQKVGIGAVEKNDTVIYGLTFDATRCAAASYAPSFFQHLCGNTSFPEPSGARKAGNTGTHYKDVGVQGISSLRHIEPSAYLKRVGGAVNPASAPLAAAVMGVIWYGMRVLRPEEQY